MSDRKQHWDQVYQQKSALDVSWYQQKPTLSLKMIHSSGIVGSAAIIDIGGGASTLVDFLLADGFSNITVLDISAAALLQAQQRLGKNAVAVNWIVSDIVTFTAPSQYELWHDRAVFHFLTDKQDRRQYVANLKRSLKSGGHVVIAAFAIGGPQKCSGLDIVQYDADKLQLELGADFQLVQEAAETHLTPDGREQKFGYFRFNYRQNAQ
jgi:ubiquinone/menaquinone biosynthesis C-methylase UbiE